ncbi:vitamin K epoxide reductase family protein [Gaetbulibacter sp. M235]|uniref:vitamin K epoxide reductase family protein n=1 Tax=Gaetbulibacter sp. M235 TaxID=3126510 RepID=UPI00374E478C
MKDQLFNVLNEYLKSSDIFINDSELEFQILSHPSYPSLHALTGVLDHFNICNLALEVSPNAEILKQLPKTFISLVNGEINKDFAVITQQNDTIKITHGNKRKISITVEEFLPIWSGVIVVVEKEDFNVQAKTINTKNISKGLYVLCGILFLSAFISVKPSLFQLLHFTLSLIGLYVSFLIVKHELGFMSRAIDKFCTANEFTSCDAVLNSKGATILKHFKLSDVCLVYFTSLALAWVLIVNSNTSDSAIIFLSLTTVPVTFYSIYYQYNVIKKWCPLCLSIVVVLWLQCSTLLVNKNTFENIEFKINDGLVLFFSLIIITTLWLIIKPLLKKEQELNKLQIQHYKFKRNFDLFNAVYHKNEIINTSSIHNKEIVLGSKKAPLHIVLVTNPKCHYCKSAHTDIENILNKHPDSIKVVIRFSISTKDKDDVVYKVINRLFEIYNTESEFKCLEALHDVYKNEANLDKWLLIWNEARNYVFDDVLESQKAWCLRNTINFTPALYINGRPFPKEYERSDISYFIEDLIEQAENEKATMLKPVGATN